MCSHGVGSVPVTAQGDCPLTAGSHRFPLPPPRAISQSLLLGDSLIFSYQDSCLSPVSGIIRKACHSEADSVSRQQVRFPGSYSPPACPLPAQARKVPLGPEPPALPGCPLPLVWPFQSRPLQGHQELLPPLGRLSAVSWGGLCGVR